ncbi:MAG: hypothetical protein ACREDR_41445, partial [Blastocatellia bacterium]
MRWVLAGALKFATPATIVNNASDAIVGGVLQIRRLACVLSLPFSVFFDNDRLMKVLLHGLE